MGSTKIAIFMDRLTPGSFPKIAGEEVRQLNKLGINTDLLLIKRGIPEKDREWLNGVSMECLEDRFPSALRANFKIPGFSFFSAFHLTAPIYGPLAVRRKYDLMIAHGTYTCFTAYSLKKLRNIPYVAFVHDPISYILRKVYTDTALRHLFPILCSLGKTADKVIAEASEVIVLPSKFHLKLVEKLTDRPIEIVYPGVKAAEKIPDGRGDYLLAVARWERGKKPFFYLDLLENLKKIGCLYDLVMVGPWKDALLRARFLKEAKKRGLLSNVRLHGSAGTIELDKFYSKARALVHPITEAFGMIGLEAAAHGCPFIIPKDSGVTDLFSHRIHGFFPQEGDLGAYVKSVEGLISDERSAWKMGYEAWKVARHYNWERHAESLMEAVKLVV